MLFPILLAIGGMGAYLYMKNANAVGGDTEVSLRDIFRKWGDRYGVDPLLLEAHAIVESNLDPDAVRWNPPSDISVGLMQILYIPTDLNDVNSPPKNRLNVDGWNAATFDKLKDPDFNVMIGAQIVRYNITTFGLPRAIAVYNNYSQRFAGMGGPFTNQSYVNKVSRAYAQLQEAS